jgi:hypothetical protein
MLPYYIAGKLYNFQRSIDEVKAWSAWPVHWLAADGRNKLWHGLGDNLPDSARFRLFPGLLPVLLSLAAVLLAGPRAALAKKGDGQTEIEPERTKWIGGLDALALFALALSITAIGYDPRSCLLRQPRCFCWNSTQRR